MSFIYSMVYNYIYIDFSNDIIFFFIVISCHAKGSPRVEGDEDEEDVDDIEQEFKMEEEKYKLMHQDNMNSIDDDDTKYREQPLYSHSIGENCMFCYPINLIKLN